MTSKYNVPVSMVIYLGSGEAALRLRKKIRRMAGKKSVSSVVIDILRKAHPGLFVVEPNEEIIPHE